MEQFIADIVAQLDTSNVDKAIKALDKTKITLDIDVDTKGLRKKVEDALKGIKMEIGTSRNSSGSGVSKGGSGSSGAIKNPIETAKLRLDTKEYEASLARMDSRLKKFVSDSSAGYANASDAIKVYQEALKNLQKTLDSIGNADSDDEIKKISSALAEIDKSSRTARSALSLLENSASKAIDPLRLISASNSFEKWCNENGKAAKQLSIQVEQVRKAFAGAQTVSDFNNAKALESNLRATAFREGLLGTSITDVLRNNITKFGQWLGAGTIFMQAVHGAKDMVEAVYEIDTAMTNLYKVTDETDAKYTQFLDNATEKAKGLGRSISSFIEQSANWAKLGYNIDESSELAEVSSIYANVGEVDDDTAVSDIVTAMKAFNIEAENAMGIIDRLNALGNNFATSSAALGDGLSNAASSLQLAGNDIDQSLAMITGMTEITQDASESGNALKILSMRLRGYDEETQEYSNDVEILSGNIADLTKTADTPGGISIFKDENKEEFRSTYEILEDISKIWDDLTGKQQADLLETLAGKQRGNSIAALIQAFQSGQVQSALSTSQDSEGSALQEQERWLDSIQAKIGQFQASFQSLSQTIISSDFLAFMVDSGTALIDILDIILDKVGMFTVVGAGMFAGNVLKNRGSSKNHRGRKIVVAFDEPSLDKNAA